MRITMTKEETKLTIALEGRLRDFFDRGEDEDIASFSSPLLLPGMYEESSTPTLD